MSGSESWSTRWPKYAFVVSIAVGATALYRDHELRQDFERDVRTDVQATCARTNAARADIRQLVVDLVSLDGSLDAGDQVVVDRAAQSLPDIDCTG